MRFTVEYPTGSPGFSPAFLEPGEMLRFVAAVEASGVDALAFTEHPAPSKKWLDHGGHESFDSLTALAFCASATVRVKLMPYLLVLPYRNPLLAAKQIATVDILSGGRVILAVGTGYLRSEFAALGVGFDERNELMDEAIAVVQQIWNGEPMTFDGRNFTAIGQVSVPPPQQLPHPPLWFGGNSRRARRRAATFGQGWAPLMIDADVARTIRTPAIASITQLRVAIDDLRLLADEAGRDSALIDVQVQWSRSADIEADPAGLLDLLFELAAVGVTWVVIRPPIDDVGRAIAAIYRYGELVIEQARSLAE